MSEPTQPGDVGRLVPESRHPLQAAARELAADPNFLALEGHGAPNADDRAHTLVRGIGERLRGVCGHLGDDEFAALVLDVARMKVKFTAIEDGWAHRPGGAMPDASGRSRLTPE